jgi:hypothetical protein
MKTKSANVSEVHLEDGRVVLLSYGTPVAVFIPGRGYLRSIERWSSTTSQHVTDFAGRRNCPDVSISEFVTLIAPITGPRG